MVVKKLEDLAAYCAENRIERRMAVIKCEDDHTMSAVMRAQASGVVRAELIGNREVILGLLREGGYDENGVTIHDVDDPEKATRKAIAMVHSGQVDYLMKGTLETKTMMKQVVARENDMRTDRLMSQVALLQNPNYHKLFALTDSALNPKPDVQQKKQILLNAVDVMHGIGVAEPKVAVLAASETVNPKLQESTDGAALKQMYLDGEITGCIVEGPISLDLSLEPESVRIKGYSSPVGGDADVLLCPDLASGNMMGKGMEFTGATSACVIVGAKTPIVLISRAATVDNKYNSILLGAISCRQ